MWIVVSNFEIRTTYNLNIYNTDWFRNCSDNSWKSICFVYTKQYTSRKIIELFSIPLNLQGMEIGSNLFKFSLKGTNNKLYDNFAFADRTALVIVVTCNHCPYARAYWKRLIKLYNQFEEDNLGILAINPNDAEAYPADSFEAMKELQKQLKLPFPYLLDEDQKVAKKLKANRTPEVFVYNSKRKLVYKGAIDDNWENENMVTRVFLEDAIEYTLDGMEPDYSEIPAVGCSIKWKK